MRKQSTTDFSGVKRGKGALLASGSFKARNPLSNHRSLSDAPVIFQGNVSERQAGAMNQATATGASLHHCERQAEEL